MADRNKKRLRRPVDEEARRKLEEKFFKKMKPVYEGSGKKYVSKCCHCQGVYELEILPWQGVGFASHADAEGISCHFGSRFDMNIFVWTNGQKAAGSICDCCVERFLVNGKIKLIGCRLFKAEVDQWTSQLSSN